MHGATQFANQLYQAVNYFSDYKLYFPYKLQTITVPYISINYHVLVTSFEQWFLTLLVTEIINNQSHKSYRPSPRKHTLSVPFQGIHTPLTLICGTTLSTLF